MKNNCCRTFFPRFISFLPFVFLLAFLVGFLVTPVQADTFWVTSVSDDVSDTGSLRYAIQNATNQDVISFDLEYPATIKLGQTLRIDHGITIQGPGAHLLKISGNDEWRVFDIACWEEPVDISGISIVKGCGNGGGIFNINSYLSVTNCTFSDNGVYSDGGGMYNDSSSPTVTNCTFTMNNAHDGGGMYNKSSNPTVTNCTFSGNEAGSAGGGMYNENSSPIVSNCTFFSNSLSAHGGGMYNVGSGPTVRNCTFSSNSAEYGGGMSNNNSNPAVTNCIFWNDNGSEIFNSGNSIPDLSHCIVKNWDISGSITISGPIYASDPKLGLLADKGGSTMTCALKEGSSAIDAGCTLSEVNTDQRGFGRPQGANFDIGAYEARTFVLTTICNDEGRILPESADIIEGSSMDFYMYPESDYCISGVYVDGNPVSYDELNCSYTFQSVSSDHVLSADFQPGGDDDNNGGGGGGGCSISAISTIGFLLLMPLIFLSKRGK